MDKDNLKQSFDMNAALTLLAFCGILIFALSATIYYFNSHGGQPITATNQTAVLMQRWNASNIKNEQTMMLEAHQAPQQLSSLNELNIDFPTDDCKTDGDYIYCEVK